MNHTTDGADSSGPREQVTSADSRPRPNFETGFPRGYFRIQAKGTGLYLQLYHCETKDGTTLNLHEKDYMNDSYVRTCTHYQLESLHHKDPYFEGIFHRSAGSPVL